MAALAEGVPLVCMPMGRDQNANADRIVALGRNTVQLRKIVGVSDAAKIFRVHKVTLYRMLESPGIPGAFKVGRVWRLDIEQLERFLVTRQSPT